MANKATKRNRALAHKSHKKGENLWGIGFKKNPNYIPRHQKKNKGW